MKGARIIFLLLEALSVYAAEIKPPSATPEFTEKHGTCPQLMFECPALMTSECEEDGDCTGELKCCLFRCKFMCVEPVLEKLGFCPPDTATTCTQKEANECDGDTECLGPKRCCFFRCGLKCRFPLPGKMGECPKQATICAPDQVIPPPKCTNDKQCPGAQKCCTPGCGKECTDPAIRERDGQCPWEEHPCSRPQGGDECVDDKDCQGLQKCCGTCKKTCKKSIQVTDLPENESAGLN
ncbi:WAP four-disulfide core domain protein 5-like [Ambystoma mexicanum]|uniref:WAP four-disulfide core domain protein 5-like n=1 Tax=Ambystoma mexicanum TaxID=8296 RepID=UPI0037E71350